MRLAPLAVVAALAAFPTAAHSQAPAAPEPARTPVVFVTFDEFPITSLLDGNGRIDAARYPNFAAFARTSTWFRSTTTVGDGTRWASPVVIGGRYPRKRSMPAWIDYPSNLLALLGGTHRVHAREPVTRMCPPRVCHGPALHPGHRGLKARAITELIGPAKAEAAIRSPLAEFIPTIRRWRRGQRPPLYFIHVLLPHHPWRWLADGRSYPLPRPALPGLVGDNVWRNQPPLVHEGWRRHLLQVGYTDLLLGRLVRRLKRVGLWDRALVAFSADHGVSFVPGRSRRAANPATVGGIAPVPFFLKAPRQHAARQVDAHVQTVDVLPTLAQVLGLPHPRGVEGRSALSADFSPKPVVELWSSTFVLRFGKRTYSLAYVQRKRDEVLARQLQLFGTGPFQGPQWGPPR